MARKLAIYISRQIICRYRYRSSEKKEMSLVLSFEAQLAGRKQSFLPKGRARNAQLDEFQTAHLSTLQAVSRDGGQARQIHFSCKQPKVRGRCVLNDAFVDMRGG